MSAEAETASTKRSYLTVLLRALAGAPHETMGDRRKIYDSAQRYLTRFFDSQDPPMDDDTREIEIRILRQTIRLLELDIRVGVDVWAPGYRPAELDAILENLERSRRFRLDRKRAFAERDREAVESNEAASPADGSDVDRLRQALVFLAPRTTTRAAPRPPSPNAIHIVRALILHQLHLISAESRIAVIWLMIQPAVLLAIIHAAYLLIDTRSILNMDVPTFALLGGGSWLMFRQVIFRVTGQISHNRSMVNFPMVTPIHQAIAGALIYLTIFMVSLTTISLIGGALGLMGPPDHFILVVCHFVGIWLLALSVGVLFGTVDTFWPYFNRLTAVIERVLQIFSSVFFVTEQLPEAYRGYFLWNPLAHGMQLLRGFYFDAYICSDASVSYFWLSVIAILSIALGAENLTRRYIQPM